jgi:hypothetical protein
MLGYIHDATHEVLHRANGSRAWLGATRHTRRIAYRRTIASTSSSNAAAVTSAPAPGPWINNGWAW